MNSNKGWKSVPPLLFAAAVRGGALAVIAGLIFLGAASGSVRPSPLTRGSSECWEPRKAEVRFLEITNDERTTAGLAELRLDPELSAVARKHTTQMVAKGELRHSSATALRTRVTNWTSLGENVGVGADPTRLHDAFMSSESHRSNVLNHRYKHIGIGTLIDDGRMWVTLVFEARRDPGTTLRMPDC